MNYDIKAASWDTEKRASRAKIIAQEIYKSIHVEDHYNVMEFGCGTGLISFNLYEKFKKITLIDTSKGMIDELNKKILSHKINNMIALQTDINTDTTLTDKYDVIYTSMALHHIIDTETTLKNLYNLLNNDGYLCIIELTEDDGTFHKLEKDFNGHNGFAQNDLKEILKNIGYRQIESRIIYNDVKHIEGENIEYSIFLMISRK